jgi:hypothetical protein
MLHNHTPWSPMLEHINPPEHLFDEDKSIIPLPSTTIIVAIIDSGIRCTHSAFRGKDEIIAYGYNACVSEGEEGEFGPNDMIPLVVMVHMLQELFVVM